MSRHFLVTLLAAIGVLSLSSCGEPAPYRKPTYSVKGQIVVDGKAPTSAIKVDCHNSAGMDQQHPSVSSCTSADDGKFEISTYESGDGGPDQLNDRDKDPSTNPIPKTLAP